MSSELYKGLEKNKEEAFFGKLRCSIKLDEKICQNRGRLRIYNFITEHRTKKT